MRRDKDKNLSGMKCKTYWDEKNYRAKHQLAPYFNHEPKVMGLILFFFFLFSKRILLPSFLQYELKLLFSWNVGSSCLEVKVHWANIHFLWEPSSLIFSFDPVLHFPRHLFMKWLNYYMLTIFLSTKNINAMDFYSRYQFLQVACNIK